MAQIDMEQDTMAMLEVNNLISGYGEVQILWETSLKLEKGKLTTLVGSNGVGKSTLLRTVMGLLRPWGGTITFQGQDMTRRSAHARAKAGLVLVPEGRQLFTDMTVLENLEMGGFPPRSRRHFKENLDRVFTLFPRLGERPHQKAGSLSGGEQQMVAVSRGLMAQPEVLIIDELSLGLSPILALTLFESLIQLKRQGLTMLLVEQNVAMALGVSDYAYVLSQGRVTLEGESRQLRENDEIRRTYMGM
jgi:branched-chain amino acid transport system ATP-binding protein